MQEKTKRTSGIRKLGVVVDVTDMEMCDAKIVSVRKGDNLYIEDSKGKKHQIKWKAEASGRYAVCKELNAKGEPVFTIYPVDNNLKAEIEGIAEIFKDGRITIRGLEKEKSLAEFIEENFEFRNLYAFNCRDSKKKLRITIEEVE